MFTRWFDCLFIWFCLSAQLQLCLLYVYTFSFHVSVFLFVVPNIETTLSSNNEKKNKTKKNQEAYDDTSPAVFWNFITYY